MATLKVLLFKSTFVARRIQNPGNQHLLGAYTLTGASMKYQHGQRDRLDTFFSGASF